MVGRAPNNCTSLDVSVPWRARVRAVDSNRKHSKEGSSCTMCLCQNKDLRFSCAALLGHFEKGPLKESQSHKDKGQPYGVVPPKLFRAICGVSTEGTWKPRLIRCPQNRENLVPLGHKDKLQASPWVPSQVYQGRLARQQAVRRWDGGTRSCALVGKRARGGSARTS